MDHRVDRGGRCRIGRTIRTASHPLPFLVALCNWACRAVVAGRTAARRRVLLLRVSAFAGVRRRPRLHQRLQAARPGRQATPVSADADRLRAIGRDGRASADLGAVLRRRPCCGGLPERPRSQRDSKRHLVPLPSSRVRRRTPLRADRLLVHVPAERQVLRRSNGRGGSRDRRRGIFHALVHGQGTEHDPRPVHGRRRRLRLDVGGDSGGPDDRPMDRTGCSRRSHDAPALAEPPLCGTAGMGRRRDARHRVETLRDGDDSPRVRQRPAVYGRCHGRVHSPDAGVAGDLWQLVRRFTTWTTNTVRRPSARRHFVVLAERAPQYVSSAVSRRAWPARVGVAAARDRCAGDTSPSRS